MNERKTEDWARNCWNPRFLVAWGIPVLAMVLSSSMQFGFAWIWPLSLAWIGTACLLNGKRCGRTHCYITGPFFIALAAAAALHAAVIIDLGPRGWQYIGHTALIGALVLTCLPDMIFGRYRRREG